MSQFWAKFESIDNATYRLDTRIYLKDIDAPMEDDQCIGAVVGKNPGSAKQSTSSSLLQSIELNGDKLLPTVLNILAKAYDKANVAIPERCFVQVLNLFYLCDKDLSQAISSYEKAASPLLCESENRSFPWVWYMWGGESIKLNPHKSRFANIIADQHFFFDNRTKQIRDRSPNNFELARHTQGLKHDFVVPYIAHIVANGSK